MLFRSEGLTVKKAQAKPEAIEFGAAEKGATLGLEVVVKIADEIDGADADEGQLLMLAVGGEKVDGIELTETRGIEVAAERFAVVKLDDHLFMGAGWGAEFQRTGSTPCRARKERQFALNGFV